MNIQIKEEVKTGIWFTANDIIEILSYLLDCESDDFKLEIDFSYESDLITLSHATSDTCNQKVYSTDLSKAKLEEIKNGIKKKS